MKITILVTFLFIFITKSLANEEMDLLLRAKKDRFLVDYFSREGFIYTAFGSANIFLHPTDPVYASKPQILVKNGNRLFISLAASGRVYQFISQDDTSHLVS